ncbi:MAG: DUF305 domain-containing protein [Lachnospiraceae bacterium]|nr:DUF305 domain-containing protein [Lachnospiraceae bacterium]
MIKEMTEAELTDSITHNFIVQMIPHHRAAIDMSYNLLEYSVWEPLRRIASQIIAEQTKSIADMEELLASGGCRRNSEQELRLYQRKMDQIMKTMFSDMNKACSSNEIDADFMREMIPHHKGAVEMSCNALQFPIASGLIPILEAIIASQEKGIRQMDALLCRLGRK